MFGENWPEMDRRLESVFDPMGTLPKGLISIRTSAPDKSSFLLMNRRSCVARWPCDHTSRFGRRAANGILRLSPVWPPNLSLFEASAAAMSSRTRSSRWIAVAL